MATVNSKKSVLIRGTVVAIVLLLSVGWFWWRISFARLKSEVHFGGSRETIGWLVGKLSNSPRGVKAALADININGGLTRGESGEILLLSPLRTNVISGLSKIVTSSDEPLERQLEALRILWLRTHDFAYPIQLFELVKNPGGWEMVHGRTSLSVVFDTNAALFEIPQDQPLPQTLSEFTNMLYTLPLQEQPWEVLQADHPVPK